jgi:hypothetical protein
MPVEKLLHNERRAESGGNANLIWGVDAPGIRTNGIQPHPLAFLNFLLYGAF